LRDAVVRSDHHAGHCAQASADHERERDHRVDVDPISPGDLLVLRRRAHRSPELRPVDRSRSPAIIATEVRMITTCTLVIVAPLGLSVRWMGVTVMICGEGDRVAAPDDHREVLQDDREADRR
jgi:hypothetical protein